MADQRPTAILTTTIRVPVFLEELVANAVRYGHRDTFCIVMGDEKTPAEARPFCESLSAKTGIPVRYFDLALQEETLKDFPELLDVVPHNSGVRKLLGNFIAWREGCGALIMVDDDNFVTDSDFVGLHRIVDTAPAIPAVRSDSGWFNVYESVVEARGIPFFPRGYPWGERHYGPQRFARETNSRRVVVNSGLVSEDPDVDAISRLFWPIRVTAMKPEWSPHFTLAPGTWCAFNNQNTALARDLIPIHFTPHATGRNADIWTSYVMFRLVEHMGDAITYGEPMARQLRNPHDLWKDLDRELVNDRATDAFAKLLRVIPLTEKTYLGALGELCGGALDRLPSLTGVSPQGAEMMRGFFREYLVWQGACLRAAGAA